MHIVFTIVAIVEGGGALGLGGPGSEAEGPLGSRRVRWSGSILDTSDTRDGKVKILRLQRYNLNTGRVSHRHGEALD